MKLLDLIPTLKDFTRIKRNGWSYFLIKHEFRNYPMIMLDLNSLEIKEYVLTYDDLMADDWEIIE